MQEIHGEPSHQLATPEVDLHVTGRAGQMAPVVFHLPGRDVSPYSLSPWVPSEFPDQPALLSVLRGDFFCLPFGPQQDGPPHGDPANAAWSLEGSDERSLTLRQQAADSGASIEKILSVRPGHHAVYLEHRISGLAGDWSYGSHPILDASAAAPGSVRLSVSPFRWGSVYPGVFSDPDKGERQMLCAGARFDELTSVPLADGMGSADLTRFPHGGRADDLVMMVAEDPEPDRPFAWTAAVFGDFVWFCLKNPADFPATLFWLSDGGRDGAPWNGRHVGRIGLEEVCSHFSNDVDLSRQGLLAEDGIPTVRSFDPAEVVSLRLVQAVAEVPPNFGKVVSISPEGDGKVLLTGENGGTVECSVDWSHVL
ncbi:hypothetical protein [Haloferula sp. A504]|uniref:hypothetical protein n=1 Tax=Haloferula sp. A504 TaxID=3373601 RepID=UPI0031BF3483|nr:hypothetical protein [Verrucomicrobiaceae bacterium E54]